MKEVEVREKSAAATSAALDKIPEKLKEKVPPPPKQKPIDAKATKAAEKKAKEAKAKEKAKIPPAAPAPQAMPSAQAEEDVGSSNEVASPIRGEWDTSRKQGFGTGLASPLELVQP